jgi:hypothetical protein
MPTFRAFAGTLLVTIVLAAGVQAQSIPSLRSTPYYGPYSAYGPSLTYKQPSFNNSPYTVSSRSQAANAVPQMQQGRSAHLNSQSESGSPSGPPASARAPASNRLQNNLGSGAVGASSITAQPVIVPGRDDETRARPRYVRISLSVSF